ncbi:MAG: hypothetical protein LJE95_00500 [Acidobacteria bacterium]|nr:hypothetical protein [Acidobacteriota bacterium]
MDLATALKRLEKLEQEMAELYRWLADLFADDRETAAFFKQMESQEASHAELVRFEKRLVRSDASSFAGLEFDPSGIDEIEGWIRAFRDDEESPSLGRALVFAMRVESHAAEHLHRTIFAGANSDLHALIGNLSRSDWKHFEALREFAAAHADSLGDRRAY